MTRPLLIALLFITTSAHAGGSFTVDVEFAPIRAQIPGLWQALESAFDLATSGSASMIGSRVNERLGHRRVGPYCLAGKPKGHQGSDTLLFCFVTDYLWLDSHGESGTLQEAVDVRESFVSLEITPLGD